MCVSTFEDAAPVGPRISSAVFVGPVGEEHREALLADLRHLAEGELFRLIVSAQDAVIADERGVTMILSRVGRALRQPPLADAVDRIALVGDDVAPPAGRPASGPDVHRLGDDWQGALRWLRDAPSPTS